MKTKKILFTVCVLVFLAVASDAPWGKITAEEKPLVFAGNNKYAPYSYFSGGKPTGFSVDLIKIISATFNGNIDIKFMSEAECVYALRNGTVDGLIGMPVNEAPKKNIDYSTAVVKYDFAIFTESTNRFVNSLKSLKGTIVGIHQKSLVVDELRKHKHIKLLETKSVLEALRKLKNHEVTAVIADKNVATYYIQQENIEDLKIVGPSVGPAYKYALAVKKGKKKLLRDINHAITVLNENGTLKKLKRKWFGVKLLEPFPWKVVSMVIGGITGTLLMLMGLLWVASLNATLKMKTRQMHAMSQKMVEKDKLAVLGKLAGQIAHELRTPLSIINNSVYLIRREGPENKEQFEKRLKTLEDKVKLSSNILESILGYSRIKAETATDISMKEWVEEVIKDIEIPKEIERDFAFEKEEPFMVHIDSHQLYSVLRNLVLNAVQAMGKKGKLTIKIFLSNKNSMVNMRVCDTGPGVPKDAVNKIFNLFYSSKITGTGLGLPISKSIIENNGGRLYLEETSEKGSCFIAKLPHSRAPIKK